MVPNGQDTPQFVGRSIEVRAESISQLFDTLDPFPFPHRDLDSDVEEFIVGWARELPAKQPLEIVVHLPAGDIGTQDADRLPGAINRYFSYRAEVLTRELKELFRIGRRALTIGMMVLGFCFLVSQFLDRYFGETAIGSIVAESLIIVGWVANWKPIEIFLYDWWPITRRRGLYRRLAGADIELRPY